MTPTKFIILCLAGWINREQQAVIEYLWEEVRVLKEILGKRPRFNDAQRCRLAAKAKKIRFGRLKEIANIATPQTLLRWFRTLVGKKYDSSKTRRVGRPSTKEEIAELVVKMARENERWGYTKIRDALRNLGVKLGRNTVKRILLAQGIEPAPERSKKTTWTTFIKAHFGMSETRFVDLDVFPIICDRVVPRRRSQQRGSTNGCEES